jgi:putative RNA 2'-phosphotransferase
MSVLEQNSKLLARWLRHRPDAINLKLDSNGWAAISELLEKAHLAGTHITHHEIMQVVNDNDKQRFSLSSDGLRIRAVQGHSVDISLGLPFSKPPALLYHGTVRKFLPAIRKQGLLPGSRRDVHLSSTEETALRVGARRGVPILLIVETFPMLRDGFRFRRSENGVWLIDSVPAKYLKFPANSEIVR